MRICPAPFGESIADAPGKKARNGGHDLVIRCGKQRRRVLAGGLALSPPGAPAKQRPCHPVSGLALSVIASRCHLSQSERPWQSAKFSVYTLRPAAARGAVRRYVETSRLCQGLPLWGSWREAPERASPAEAAQGVGLDSANDGADFRKAQSKLTRCVLVSGLALSVIASRCHLSQSERPWQSAKFPVYTLRPAAARGAVRRYVETSRLCQGLSLWESWREAPERARMLPARLRPGLDGANDGADFRKP